MLGCTFGLNAIVLINWADPLIGTDEEPWKVEIDFSEGDEGQTQTREYIINQGQVLELNHIEGFKSPKIIAIRGGYGDYDRRKVGDYTAMMSNTVATRKVSRRFVPRRTKNAPKHFFEASFYHPKDEAELFELYKAFNVTPPTSAPPAPPAPFPPFMESTISTPSQSKPAEKPEPKPTQPEQKKRAEWNGKYDFAVEKMNANFPKQAYDLIINNELNLQTKNAQGKTLLDLAKQAQKKAKGKKEGWDKLMELLK